MAGQKNNFSFAKSYSTDVQCNNIFNKMEFCQEAPAHGFNRGIFGDIETPSMEFPSLPVPMGETMG
jgi:hypothetical protein